MPSRRRPGLSTARIVGAAMDLVGERGLDALTVRTLAARLDTSPASLYRHVADRRDLLRAMLDVVAARIAVPPAHDDPVEEVVALVRAVRDVLHAHPWAVRVLLTERLVAPSIMELAERLYAALAGLGLDPVAVAAADALVLRYVYGEVLATTAGTGPPDAPRRAREAVPGSHTAALSGHLDTDAEKLFEQNVRTIVAGLTSRHGTSRGG